VQCGGKDELIAALNYARPKMIAEGVKKTCRMQMVDECGPQHRIFLMFAGFERWLVAQGERSRDNLKQLLKRCSRGSSVGSAIVRGAPKNGYDCES
jgi:hypothetical protein